MGDNFGRNLYIYTGPALTSAQLAAKYPNAMPGQRAYFTGGDVMECGDSGDWTTVRSGGAAHVTTLTSGTPGHDEVADISTTVKTVLLFGANDLRVRFRDTGSNTGPTKIWLTFNVDSLGNDPALEASTKLALAGSRQTVFLGDDELFQFDNTSGLLIRVDLVADAALASGTNIVLLDWSLPQ